MHSHVRSSSPAPLHRTAAAVLSVMVRDMGLDRLERWMAATLERPSAQATMPEEEVLVEHALRFVKPLKD